MKKKIFFVKNSLLKITLNEIKTFSRGSTVIPKFINKSMKIYNGKNFSKFKITKNTLNFKLGEFSPTRKTYKWDKK